MKTIALLLPSINPVQTLAQMFLTKALKEILLFISRPIPHLNTWFVIPIAHSQKSPIRLSLLDLFPTRLVPVRPLQPRVPLHVNPLEALPLDHASGRRVSRIPRRRPEDESQRAGPGPGRLAFGEGAVVGGERERGEGAWRCVEVEPVFVLDVVVTLLFFEEIEVLVFGPEDFWA